MARGRPAPERRARRLQRLQEELEESGLPAGRDPAELGLIVDETDRAMRPAPHERRVQSSGTIINPRSDPATWDALTRLEIGRESVGEHPLGSIRRFTDGLSSWLVRNSDGSAAWLTFDRPAGSERDLTVLAAALDAVVVQRSPAGAVVIVGDFGVFRTRGFDWHHEPPVEAWFDSMRSCAPPGDPEVLAALLAFAVHDLGALGIGATFVYRPDADVPPPVEERLPTPPPLHILTPFHLAPLRHALVQVDGAAVFDHDGTLRQLGVRLVPSVDAEAGVGALGGTRHTSARRYSFDDPNATVIVVSEDGPVTVIRHGTVLGRSPAEPDGSDPD